MCTTCGCSTGNDPTYTDLRAGGHGHDHGHDHDHDHVHAHDHDHEHPHDHDHEHPQDHHHSHDPGHTHEHRHDGPAGQGRMVAIEQAILAKNQLAAERNRGWLAGREVLAVNLMSSPGAGKTSILERTIRDLRDTVQICVLEGDQATTNDAERIRAAGAPVVQINTGTGCHLEADMVARGMRQLEPARGSMLLIENVGNLVCPALFDLGEQAKVVIMSVTEGEDKPIKYPHMFRACELMLLNKIDLLPHLRFDVERCIGYARQVNPRIRVLQVSAETGQGMQTWYQWLRGKLDFQSDDATRARQPVRTI